jgi:guanine nucleotide-binding protein subunit alpha
VIQLNLVRNVNTILDMLARVVLESPSTNADPDDDQEATDSHYARSLSNNFPVQLAEKYDRLNLRLSPLRMVQRDLEAKLGAASSEETSTVANGVYDASLGLNALAERRARGVQEFCVNSNNGWKSALNRVLPASAADNGLRPNGMANGSARDSISEIIASCRGDIMALWGDPIIHEILSRTPARIQDSPGL